MTETEYLKLSSALQKVSKHIPVNWGKVQNNNTDAKLNLFNIKTIRELEEKIKSLTAANQNYFRRRWFLWQCSKVDEHLFYKLENISKNPNSKDQDWDIEFHNSSNLRFDVKGTVVPKKYRANFDVSMEQKIINFFYTEQSTGVRNYLQNRLFIVHHSFRNTDRSVFLRCHWKLKEEAYKAFNEQVSTDMPFIEYQGVKAKCIFILETKENEFLFHIN
jgi:hypothetical protein